MRFHVLTLFPRVFAGPFDEGVIKRGRDAGLIEIRLHNIRHYAHDRHRTVDDYPFGGGPGMLMKPEPLFEGVEAIRALEALDDSTPIVLLSPQGRPLDQALAERFARQRDVVLICGRYEGVDERVRSDLATEDVSIGDYVLSGGELAALVVIEAVSRLVPGVLGSAQSTCGDTFAGGLLQYPQYTRPAEFHGSKVPDVLLSGNHAEIARWRRQESLRRTLDRRPDLFESADLSSEDQDLIASWRRNG